MSSDFRLVIKKKTLFLVIFLGIFVWILISFIVTLSNFSFDGEYINDTKFGVYENKVYFSVEVPKGDLMDMLLLKNIRHLEVVGADANSFKPFYTKISNHGIKMGADKNSVFWQTEKLEGIDINKFTYLGSNYTKDDKSVFYTNKRIETADPSSFFPLHYLESYYSIEYPQFAKDKQNVYYGHKALTKLDPNNVQVVMGTGEFVKDKSYVFYKDKELEGVNPTNFKVYYIRDNVAFGTDEQNHFINGMSFPNEIDNNKIDKKNLQTLQSPLGNMGVLLFSDKNGVYYYDEQEEEFYSVDIPNLINFKDGLFTDGKYIFYTEIDYPRTFKQNNMTGRSTKIYRSEIEIENFNTYYENEDMTVYQYKEKYYVYLKKNPSGGHSIFREVIDINNIEPRIKVDNTKEISNKELIKKVFQEFNF